MLGSYGAFAGLQVPIAEIGTPAAALHAEPNAGRDVHRINVGAFRGAEIDAVLWG